MNPKQGSKTPYWLTYRENREFSMTESNTSYNGESNKLKCFRLRPSIETRWPAWNDLKLHKLKDENKRKHHPQTSASPKTVTERPNNATVISNVTKWEKTVSVGT